MAGGSQKVGLIGGTGALQFAPVADDVQQLVLPTRYASEGVSAALWKHAGHEVYFILRHGPEAQIPPHKVNYRANIDALRNAGVERVISLNACGGIGGAATGTLVIPDQMIDYTWGREHTFYDAEEGSPPLDHIEFTNPFSEPLRQSLIAAASACGIEVTEGGVYGVTQGPRLETAAEVNKLERDGCDIVGMTAMPEAALAVEAGLEYASLSGIVNQAAGRSSGAIHAQIEASVAACMQQSHDILLEYLSSAD